MFPESLDPIECRLLNDPIVCVGGTRPAITDNRPGIGGVRRVYEEIPLEIVRPVVERECSFSARVPFKPDRACSGVNHGRSDVSSGGVWPNNQLRPVTREVAGTPVAPIGIAQEEELSEHLIAGGDLTAASDI